MSGREWKPGDLAVIDLRGDASHAIARRTTGGWRCIKDDYLHLAGTVLDARPIAVIDPEDREQVERLARDNYDRIHRAGDYDALSGMSQDVLTDFMQAGLREFADPIPSKPDEPQGLGAVVEDAEGEDWHRTRDGRWIAQDGLRSRAAGWGHIAAVRVLSEGVPSC